MDWEYLWLPCYFGISAVAFVARWRGQQRRARWVAELGAALQDLDGLKVLHTYAGGTFQGVAWAMSADRAVNGVLTVDIACVTGWRAGRGSDGLGLAPSQTGDLAFDAAVAVHDDAACALGVLTAETREALAGWVREGGGVAIDTIHLPIGTLKTKPQAAAERLRTQLPLAVALRMPEDKTAAFVARLGDSDLTTRLCAAHALGKQLPEAHREGIRKDAWTRLASAAPPTLVTHLLDRMEVRGADVTQRLVPLLDSQARGVPEAVAELLASLGTTDAIMPLQAAASSPRATRKLRSSIARAIEAIRSTLDHVDGGRLALAEDASITGRLAIADERAGAVSVAARSGSTA